MLRISAVSSSESASSSVASSKTLVSEAGRDKSTVPVSFRHRYVPSTPSIALMHASDKPEKVCPFTRCIASARLSPKQKRICIGAIKSCAFVFAASRKLPSSFGSGVAGIGSVFSSTGVSVGYGDALADASYCISGASIDVADRPSSSAEATSENGMPDSSAPGFPPAANALIGKSIQQSIALMTRIKPRLALFIRPSACFRKRMQRKRTPHQKNASSVGGKKRFLTTAWPCLRFIAAFTRDYGCIAIKALRKAALPRMISNAPAAARIRLSCLNSQHPTPGMYHSV